MLTSNWYILLLFLILQGCQSRDIRPKTTGTEYFPLKVKGFWVYDVVETNISQVGGQTNSTYELKIQIMDSVLASGQTTYLLARSKRSDPAMPWSALETWSARKDQFHAILQEGNTSYVKLSFPLSEGKTWNGNALNDLGGTDKCVDNSFNCENYEATAIAKRYEAPGISYEDSVTIIENNDNDPIVKQDIRKSVYAKSIGLVYREVTILEYCTVGTCLGKQIVENGTILKQTVKDYGGL